MISTRKRRIIEREARRVANGWKRYTPPPQLMLDLMRGMGIAAGAFAKPGKYPCGARTRSGEPCKALALANGRCRNHGGLSTGPKTKAGWARTRAGYRAWRAARGPVTA